MSDEQLELPGIVPEVRESDSLMVVAAKRTLSALEKAGRVEERHAVLATMVVQLSAAIDKGTASGRASAVAMAAAQLRETVLVLDPPPEDGDAAVEAARLMREFMDAVERAADQHRESEL